MPTLGAGAGSNPGETGFDRNLVECRIVEIGEATVPAHVPPLGIEDDEAFGHDIEGLYQLDVRALDFLRHEAKRTIGAQAVALWPPR